LVQRAKPDLEEVILEDGTPITELKAGSPIATAGGIITESTEEKSLITNSQELDTLRPKGKVNTVFPKRIAEFFADTAMMHSPFFSSFWFVERLEFGEHFVRVYFVDK
jgi:hypothetical protein